MPLLSGNNVYTCDFIVPSAFLMVLSLEVAITILEFDSTVKLVFGSMDTPSSPSWSTVGLLYIHNGHWFQTELACEEVSCAIFLLVFIVLDFLNGQEKVYQERNEVGTSWGTQEGAKQWQNLTMEEVAVQLSVACPTVL